MSLGWGLTFFKGDTVFVGDDLIEEGDLHHVDHHCRSSKTNEGQCQSRIGHDLEIYANINKHLYNQQTYQSYSEDSDIFVFDIV